jgi:hypothetical protein
MDVAEYSMESRRENRTEAEWIAEGRADWIAKLSRAVLRAIEWRAV